MAFKDLIPWRDNGKQLNVRRENEMDDLMNLQDEMNQLFSDFFRRPFGLYSFADQPFFSEMGDFSPRVDLSETEKAYKLSVELPGMEPEEIDISMADNILSISGEKKAEKEDKGKRYYRVERSYGSFQRRIPLPNQVKEDKVEARFKNGVLTIELPKTEEAKKHSRRIEVKTG
jgi:HSP20 family protein